MYTVTVTTVHSEYTTRTLPRCTTNEDEDKTK